MQRHEDTVTDSYGNITTSASITVNVHGGGAATVYSDNGITILAHWCGENEDGSDDISEDERE
jgi:hypothetical protein